MQLCDASPRPLFARRVRRRSPRAVLGASALSFTASFLACCCIAPSGLGLNGGLSDFGGHLATFVPYWVGLWSLSYGTWWVASSRKDRLEQLLLHAVSVLVAVVVFTFSALGNFFNTTHVVLGSAAFTLTLALSLYATLRPSASLPPLRRLLALGSLGVELVAWGLAALWLYEVQGHLIWAQFAFFLAFLANAMTWLSGEPGRAPETARP